MGPGPPERRSRGWRYRQDATRGRHGGLNVTAAVMVMADRNWLVIVPIRAGIGNLIWSHMDMHRVVIVI